MQRALCLIVLACGIAAWIAGCSRSRPDDQPQAAAKPAPAAKRSDGGGKRTAGTHLTVYSGDYERLAAGTGPQGASAGFALVDRILQYALKPGGNRISASGMPRTMDADAATLRPLGQGMQVLSQRYVAPPRGSNDVVAAAIGKRIAVEHTSGGSKQTDSGTLVSASGGLTLALADGRTKVIREYDNFSVIDAAADVPRQATLQWTVQAPQAGDARFELSYPMGGMAWRAEYLATLASGRDCKLDLDGAALVANRSGVGFDDAKLTLVAGEPRRVHQQEGVVFDDPSPVDVQYAAAAAPPAPQQRISGEYHAYELPGTFQVSNGSTERVPLFARLQGVACERVYETTPEVHAWDPPQPLIDPGFNDGTGPQPVKATVALQNDEKSGLGHALPAGRVRVFEGRDFLGESMLGHSPKGVEVRLETGTVFDLTAERERTSFRVDRAGRTMTESFAVTLRNARDADATIMAVEPVPRWSDWSIAESSVPAKKRDARNAEFEVQVPANGETRLTYTARYRWAPGVRP